MKILYCITRSTWGGAQENIWELIKNQVKLKNQAILVVGDNGDLAQKVRKNLPDVKVIILPCLQRSIDPRKDITSILKLRKIIKNENPNIVHLHSSKAGVIGRIASRNLKCKVIFTVHGWSFTDGIESTKKKAVYRFIERRMEPLTDRYICVSKFDYNIGIRDKVIKNPKKAYVVYNGVALKKRKKTKVVSNSPVKFVMTARFSKQKDQISLIKAFKATSCFNWKLTFVGDGPTIKKAKNLVSTYNLKDKINFVGFQDDVDSFLVKNNIFVLSTHYEGLPISIIEAMSYSLPIIASNVGGDSELVKDKENGFLVNDPKDFTRAIEYFCRYPEKANEMGNKSFRLFLRKFTLDSFLSNTQRVYEDVIKE
ncbi:glycosyltransferase family 4 protein [Lactobacillus gallinarum]|nr:glycosyltransferase family 4 protein [Lactobacillus gallinarum]